MFEFEIATDIRTLRNAWEKLSARNSACGVDGIDRTAIGHNISAYFKGDIRKFYDNVDRRMLMKKLAEFVGDGRFLELVRRLLAVHRRGGISAGSCLSPVLSNFGYQPFRLSFTCKTMEYKSLFDVPSLLGLY